ncbi:MAG: plastocyanin/azurin family copper-binding protein [Wenzhouxiangellaceae bacterium]
MIRRRAMLAGLGGLAAFSAFVPGLVESDVIKIDLASDMSGARVGFEPTGVFVVPGQSVRWINRANVHTVTAYHPDNARHSLRIPKQAKPWDSGYLVEPGAVFELRLEVPGVYDYYCAPHEEAGMAGRIVVGEISGPGSLPFDYFENLPEAGTWRRVPDAVRKRLPDADSIVGHHFASSQSF